MAELSFNLGELFERTFGYKTQAFNPVFQPLNSSTGMPTRREAGAYGSPYYSNDAQGREYYMPVKLTYPDQGNTKSPQAVADGTNRADATGVLKSWYLPYPIISINSRKTIVETPLTERRGTVKELINIQDYEIVIKGFIIGDANEFPENDVTILRTLYEQNIELSIECPLTDIFLLRPDRSGSDHVIIQELNFPAITGVKNIRPYQLRMVSDEPFNLITIS
jgi:Domain of unknown function (DUF6046)